MDEEYWEQGIQKRIANRNPLKVMSLVSYATRPGCSLDMQESCADTSPLCNKSLGEGPCGASKLQSSISVNNFSLEPGIRKIEVQHKAKGQEGEASIKTIGNKADRRASRRLEAKNKEDCISVTQVWVTQVSLTQDCVTQSLGNEHTFL